MKAVLYSKYGSPEVLELKEIEKPEPKNDEILVRLIASSVTSGDTRLRSSNFPLVAWLIVRLIYGLFRPRKRILGHEFSGVVEDLGKDVDSFNIGDEVIGTPTMLETGAYVEYICVPQSRTRGVLASKPSNIDLKNAAALPVGGMTALYLLENAKLAKGDSVLIYGASGSVGSYAVQIAKATEANVAAVCSSANFELVKHLGADMAIDYKTEDFTKLDKKFDVVFDAVGKISKSKASKIMKDGGRFVTVKSITKPTQLYLNKLIKMVEKGTVKPYIDKSFPLSEIRAAHAYVDKGRKKGNVIIEIGIA